jgi:hypothetical protein
MEHVSMRGNVLGHSYTGLVGGTTNNGRGYISGHALFVVPSLLIVKTTANSLEDRLSAALDICRMKAVFVHLLDVLLQP